MGKQANRELEAAITEYGLSKLAGGVNVTPQTLNNWRGRGVPSEQAPAVELYSKGKYSCERLCPGSRWYRVPDPSWPHSGGRPLEDRSGALVAAEVRAEHGTAASPRRPKKKAQRDGPTSEPKDAKYDPTKPRSATNNPGDRAGDKGGS